MDISRSELLSISIENQSHQRLGVWNEANISFKFSSSAEGLLEAVSPGSKMLRSRLYFMVQLCLRFVIDTCLRVLHGELLKLRLKENNTTAQKRGRL